jgi:hypothetical protein
MKYIGKKHRECENSDIYQLQTETITDLSTLKCNNYEPPVFPYINYALLYQYLPQNSQDAIKDALSIKKLLEAFFESIKLYKRIQSELYEEARKIAEKNDVDLCNFTEGDLDYFI